MAVPVGDTRAGELGRFPMMLVNDADCALFDESPW